MTDATEAPFVLTMEQDHGDGWECALVEIFGHRSHAGFIREEERYGTKMLRIDVPKNGDPERTVWETHWYGGASIFSLTLTDAHTVFKANKRTIEPGRYLAPPDDNVDNSDDGEEHF